MCIDRILEMRQSVLRHIVLVFALSSVCSAAALNAVTITVDLSGGGDFTEIQPAMDAAVDGDEVVVARGTYEITIPISFLGKAITLRSADGPEATIIRMGDPADPARGSVVVFDEAEPAGTSLTAITYAFPWRPNDNYTYYFDTFWDAGKLVPFTPERLADPASWR